MDKRRSPQLWTCCGDLSWPSDPYILEERKMSWVAGAKKLTSEPSAIRDGTAEGRRVWVVMATPSNEVALWRGGRPAAGDRPTVGHVLVRQPRGENEKIARGWDHRGCWLLWSARQWCSDAPGQPARGFTLVLKSQGQDKEEARAGTIAATIGNEAWRDRFGSVHGGPVLRQRIDKEATKDDKRTGRQTGGGEGGKLWKPRKRITDLFHCRSWAKHPHI